MSARRSNQLALALADGANPADVLTAAGHGAAAAEVQGGRPLDEVLQAHRLVPQIYRGTFAASPDSATRALVEAAARHESRGARARSVTRAALLSAAFAWTVMIAASVWAVPVFLGQLGQCDQVMPGTVRFGLSLFSVLASPLGIIAAVALVVGVWWGAGALWIRSPAGRRSEAAFAATALAALVEAGITVREALQRVASATHRSARLRGAADALASGTPMHLALLQARVTRDEDGELIDRAGAELGHVLQAIATIREAEEAARAPHAGQWIWAIYAIIVGSVAAAFAALIMSGTVAVVQCVG